MSLEKLEINKFSHDASLTGDGSNNSPLGINFNGITGLKPYTERLLFSAELSGVSSIELPTSKNHFERLRFVLGAQNWKENGLESKEFGTEPTAIHLNFKNGAGGNAYWVGTYGTWTDDRHLTIQKSKNVYGSYSNANITGNISWTADDINCIKEIYGINEYPRYNFYGFSSIGGNIESNLNEGYSGDIATLTTIPETEDWKCSALNITGATLTGNDFMFTNSNVSAQAEFEHNKTLTLINGDHGILSADKDKGFIGDVVTVTGTMDEGWYLTGFNTTGATMTGNKFAFAGEDVTVEGLYTDEGFPVVYEADNGVHLTGDSQIAIPGQGVTLTTSYDTYYRTNGYDITGGYIENGMLYATAACTARLKSKLNAFTATGDFGTCQYTAKSNGNCTANSYLRAHTGDWPSNWPANGAVWSVSNASAYGVKANTTWKIYYQYNNSYPTGWGAVVINGSIKAVTSYSPSKEGNFNCNMGYNSTQGKLTISGRKVTKSNTYDSYLKKTAGSWTATGYAP